MTHFLRFEAEPSLTTLQAFQRFFLFGNISIKRAKRDRLSLLFLSLIVLLSFFGVLAFSLILHLLCSCSILHVDSCRRITRRHGQLQFIH